MGKIKGLLKEHNIPYYSIKGRPKEIYSIYNKMNKISLFFVMLLQELQLQNAYLPWFS